MMAKDTIDGSGGKGQTGQCLGGGLVFRYKMTAGKKRRGNTPRDPSPYSS